MGKFFFLLCDCSRRPEQNAAFYHIVGARCSTRSLDAAAGLMESIQTFIKVVCLLTKNFLSLWVVANLLEKRFRRVGAKFSQH